MKKKNKKEQAYIYESPDAGKTIYRRYFCETMRINIESNDERTKRMAFLHPLHDAGYEFSSTSTEPKSNL